jgi:hypothetical protein
MEPMWESTLDGSDSEANRLSLSADIPIGSYFGRYLYH